MLFCILIWIINRKRGDCAKKDEKGEQLKGMKRRTNKAYWKSVDWFCFGLFFNDSFYAKFWNLKCSIFINFNNSPIKVMKKSHYLCCSITKLLNYCIFQGYRNVMFSITIWHESTELFSFQCLVELVNYHCKPE